MKGAEAMINDPNIKNEELSPEALDKVSGGTGENFDMERFQENMEEIMSGATLSIKDATTHPHSKKGSGKLFKR